jgi:peroxiredoxin
VLIKQANITGSSIKIAEHFGDEILIKHELKSDDKGVSLFYFKGLNSGIYYIIFSDSSSYEFMYDSNFTGKILFEQDEANLTKLISAPEITLKYDAYVKSIKAIADSINSIKTELRQNDLKQKEKKKLLKESDDLYLKKDSLLTNLTKNYKGSLLEAYCKALIKIKVPDYQPESSIVNKDSAIWAWKLQYYNTHFLDHLDLQDKRLINTPIYTSIINKYLDNITLQRPENLKAGIDNILNKVDANTKIFTTNYLLKKYNAKKQSPIYEVAYLYIIEKYYLHAASNWISNSDLQALTNEYNTRKPLVINQPAPNIVLNNKNGEQINLSEIRANYTVLYFHTYDCSICQKTTPILKRQLITYAPSEVKVLAICCGKDATKCKNTTSLNNELWVDLFDSTQINKIIDSYNIEYTPSLFLLDKDKHILSKNLTIEQLLILLKELNNK